MQDEATPIPDLAGWLKRHSDADSLTLSHADVRRLHEELQRQRQSADRLRRQNRKVRIKVDRLREKFGLPSEETSDSESTDA